ncbi:NAD(P)-dependent dehydrogenase, short-chain alcohol dehydrogenase family [Catalinimonas alkaloidigena]|uniref:NAD(P)-dependent dehydrogenase, short-chain alcohol dehydrogenase family n=1 Tax=Catalinimonas alkaloidigena TaxID=1075417 RepID=A0A1G8X431_9BACT|nr:SDR family oxidoreductase [Catalinimonas alkaloidigena]SDJ84605.1 NAD(P)-dependent dehydrogenase, short-chain alcohol dehydrogenase family [Catalinimonas alkaloidigena]
MKTTSGSAWALILGGSSGIGLACVHKLLEKGWAVCAVYRERRAQTVQVEDEFEELRAQGGTLLSLNLDATTDEGQQQILEKLAQQLQKTQGKIGLLLHAVARGNLKPMAPLPFEKRTEDLLEESDLLFTIQAMGTNWLRWTRHLLDRDMLSRDARILALTSEGNQRAWRSYAAVSAAKGVLEALARSMALELAPYGLRTNLIQAGITDTPSLRMIPGSDQLLLNARKRNPLGRLTTPEDIANVVWLLSLPEAAWVNGAIIRVDGGEAIV